MAGDYSQRLVSAKKTKLRQRHDDIADHDALRRHPNRFHACPSPFL